MKDERVRDKINDALLRQDSCAKVSFIVVDKSIQHLKKFSIKDYEVLNRSKMDGRSFAKGGQMRNARIFKVGIKKRKVVLTGMDGRKADRAERLIFIISRKDLQEQAKKTK